MCGLGNRRDLLSGTVLLQGSFSFFVPTAGHRESTWAGRDPNGTAGSGSVSQPLGFLPATAETGPLRGQEGPAAPANPGMSSSR